MNKRVLKTILVLVSMLFLNIEAAQAGLVYKLKLLISSEIPAQQMPYYAVMMLATGFLAYVIFSPLRINDQRLGWHAYFTFNGRQTIRRRRMLVKRINHILLQNKVSDQQSL